MRRMLSAETDAPLGRDTVVRLLGNPLIASTVNRISSRRLRVLAYHGVPDRAAFARQLAFLRDRYVVVSPADVVDAIDGVRELPRNAVWITFDDARPTVITEALPELVSAGLHATLFVCPGLVQSAEPYWFDVVIGAALSEDGFEYQGQTRRDRAVVTEFKSIADTTRRELTSQIDVTGIADLPRQITREELIEWHSAGMSVGNHTFDHPCLDQCSPAEQERQITAAHELLSEWMGSPPQWFAYPNGDWTPESETILANLGYTAAALFDHHLAQPSPGSRFQISRLRVDSWVNSERFRAILSGGHSGLFGLVGRLRRS